MGTDRLFSTEKYWLKRARVAAAALRGAAGLERATADGGAPDHRLPGHRLPDYRLVDIRIEAGMIRAVLPAGGAPCCCRGVDLSGGAVAPLAPDGLVIPGVPADLTVDCGPGGRVLLRAGMPDGQGCSLGLACVCTPPLRSPPDGG